jgi:hypothetical protein
MRHVALAGFFAIASIAAACGPDPNAQLPGSAKSSPANENGGSVPPPAGTGGATVTPAGTGGASSPFGDGGAGGTSKPTGSGGSSTGKGGATVSAGGSGAGGAGPGQGGAAGMANGGSTTVTGQGGSGGTSTPTSGALTSYTFPASTEPCTPAKDISGGQSGNFGTKDAFCFRTADDFSDYGCNNTDGRTLKINGTAVTTCGGKAPAKLGSFYYFDFGPGSYEYAGVSWYCSVQGCGGPHAVPACGHYPTWQSGATVAPCADSPTPAADAAVPPSTIDSGS